ncbi:MAG: extracellular solute-binding protein, partial [Bacilli bacterium]|nr:extracellular solute-binding protein [Bacilli bacterium]
MKKFLSTILVLTLLISIVGCAKKEETSTDSSTTESTTGSTTTESTTSTTTSGTDAEAFSYPMESKEFTYWMAFPDSITTLVTNFGETPLAKELQERTGVAVEYIHPTIGQVKEQFNLMVTSGDLPDIIEYNVLRDYPGGPEKAIQDGIIIDLTEYIPKYAPNMMKYYEENPEALKQAKTDTGKLYSFPFVRGDEFLKVFFGPVVNQQWLKDLNLEYPETMDDWYNMLTLFKTEKGATAPLTYEPSMINNDLGSPFIGAFGIAEDFYLDANGKIQYGSIQPEYKEFLTTFNQWYEEGLIDADIETMNREQVAAKLTTGESGASMGYMASRLGTWLDAVEGNSEIDFIGVKYPVLNRGDIPMFTQKDRVINGSPGDAYISTSCEDIEGALRYLDYGYTLEGSMLYNFGIEGTTYTMEGDYPTYTDLLMSNPEMTRAEVFGLYVRSSYNGPFVQRKEYIEQYGFKYDQQRTAMENWLVSDVDKYRMPNVTPSPEESQEIATIMNEINTYRDEMQVKY